MKLWLIPIASIVIFSGCSNKSKTYQLQNINARQATYIKKQQAQIAALEAKLKAEKKARMKRNMPIIPPAPKKNIKLKKVEDNNYSSKYMYPGAKKKKTTTEVVNTSTTPSTSMTRAECIDMIGQVKFDKYTQMFGSEASSLKRCKMLKAMK